MCFMPFDYVINSIFWLCYKNLLKVIFLLRSNMGSGGSNRSEVMVELSSGYVVLVGGSNVSLLLLVVMVIAVRVRVRVSRNIVYLALIVINYKYVVLCIL